MRTWAVLAPSGRRYVCDSRREAETLRDALGGRVLRLGPTRDLGPCDSFGKSLDGWSSLGSTPGVGSSGAQAALDDLDGRRR